MKLLVITITFLLIVLGGVNLVAPIDCAAADALLEEVRVGNKAALESIRTFYCRVSKSTTGAPEIGIPASTGTVAYWWSEGASRVKAGPADGFDDSVHRDATLHTIARQQRDGEERFVYMIARVVPPQPPTEFDPWGPSMLKLHCGPRSWPVSLEELLEAADDVGPAKRQTDEGREAIVVPVSVHLDPDLPAEFQIWFDPKLNYLAYKLVGSSTDPRTKKQVGREETAYDHVEVAPGVFFPARGRWQTLMDGKARFQRDYEFTDVRVNDPIAPETFELKMPPHAEVIDSVENMNYKVDAHGKLIGAKMATPSPAPLSGSHASDHWAPTSATREEPKPVTRWILPGSVAVLLMAGAVWMYRKWRQGTDVT